MRIKLWQKSFFFIVSLFCYLFSQTVHAGGIHNVPIILTANDLRPILFHPLNSYRIFRTNSNGEAEAIPFQIDQKDRYGDYILGEGKNPNSKSSNGILNFQDELCFMGNDVGEAKAPTIWKM